MCVPGRYSVGVGESVIVAPVLTVVFVVAVLLAGFGSETSELTVAVLLTVAGAVTFTTIVTVAVPALASVPTLHETVVAPVHEPADGVAVTKATPAGKVSVTVTFPAEEGPRLVAVRVNVRLLLI
jgi:hypothetical protein